MGPAGDRSGEALAIIIPHKVGEQDDFKIFRM